MAQATYELEDMVITFEANMERNDYGVSGSPVWYEPSDVEVVAVEILGVDVDPKVLPKALINEMLSYADEIEAEEW
jgi:hypothetical protein